MKVFLTGALRLTLSALLASVSITAAHAEPTNVAVEISGLRSNKGSILVALHDNRTSFPSDWGKAVVSARAPAAEGKASISLELPRAGRFALIVVHDEDGDGRMTKNLIGFPREGYATGRNASSLEFPTFDPALRDWRSGTVVAVKVLYP
jgi:uncharacterized protein (DUF2141 family)